MRNIKKKETCWFLLIQQRKAAQIRSVWPMTGEPTEFGKNRTLRFSDPSQHCAIFREHQAGPAYTLVRRPRFDSLQIQHVSRAILTENPA